MNTHRGFSLLEAVLSLTVLGVTLVAIAQMFQTGALAQASARERTQAIILAQMKMEEVLGQPFILVQASSVEPAIQGSSGQRFNRWVNVQSVEAHPYLKRVWVNVSWIGRSGYTTHRLETLVSDHHRPTASRLHVVQHGGENDRLEWNRRRGGR